MLRSLAFVLQAGALTRGCPIFASERALGGQTWKRQPWWGVRGPSRCGERGWGWGDGEKWMDKHFLGSVAEGT